MPPLSAQIRPLADRVLVRRHREHKSAGGILIPETEAARTRPKTGVVLAVGPGKLKEDGTRLPMELKRGDRVIFNNYGGLGVEIPGEKRDDDLLLLEEKEILGVLPPEKE